MHSVCMINETRMKNKTSKDDLSQLGKCALKLLFECLVDFSCRENENEFHLRHCLTICKFVHFCKKSRK